MSEIESFVNSLRAMELPKGAESLLGNILSRGNALLSERDALKKSLDKREEDNKTARDRVKALEDILKAVPDADTLTAYTALGKPDDLKASLEQAAKDRKELVVSSNRAALTELGLKGSAVRLPEFAGVTVTAKKEGDTVTGTVKEGDAETPWADWVKAKGLEADLKDFGLEPAPAAVAPALGQVGGRQATTRLSTPEEIAESQKNDPKYSI